MKATDLRIGNKFECMGMIQTVFEICDNTDRGKIKQNGYEHIIRCIENGNQYKPIEINYIPLTEEWLLKFGFICHQTENESRTVFYSKDWGINGVEIICINYHSYKEEFEYQIAKARYKSIKYVHELQNLYFALTGEELIIK